VVDLVKFNIYAIWTKPIAYIASDETISLFDRWVSLLRITQTFMTTINLLA